MSAYGLVPLTWIAAPSLVPTSWIDVSERGLVQSGWMICRCRAGVGRGGADEAADGERDDRHAPLPMGEEGAAALVAASCSSDGSGGNGPYSEPAASTTSSRNAAAPAGDAPTTTIGLASSPFGSLLVDQQSRTVYLFEQDTSGISTCDGVCAAAWPPVLTSTTPAATTDVTRADLGTTTRRDGTQQVTYHGHPLYRFTDDVKPGDTTGQGLVAFGARWYVVGADGRPID